MSPPQDFASQHKVALDVLDSLLEGCQVIDPQFRYVYVNHAVARQAQRSRESLLGRTMTECFPGIEGTAMFETLRACMESRTHQHMENEFEYPDGTKGWFDLRFIPVQRGVCVLSLDVTEQKRSRAALARTEAQLRHAQKMEAVGRLAGGIAHDFNNVLSVVLSYAELMMTGLGATEPIRGDLEEIQKAGQRAAELTRQLLAFSRQQVLDLKVIDLDESLAAMGSMLQRVLGADVEMAFFPSNGPWRIKADPGQLEQVVMNLVVNARDAMPSGGKLTIETEGAVLDEEYARMHHGVRPGRYVMLAVSDTGIGMDEETKSRIFEPFFTTKEKGKGTGLGLSTVFGIVSQSGGHVWVYSEPGRGTTFKLYFPVVDGDVDRTVVESHVAEPERGTETILLVEDDEQVRALAKGILRRHGYVVLEAPNAGEAMLICEQHASPIHLLLTDVVLPRMTGRQLAERLAPSRPDMKVLFMSGYADDAVLQHGLLESDVAYLQKPLTPRSLATKVRAVLAG